MQMEQMEISSLGLKDYLMVILDRKWIVLLVFLLVTASAVYYAETTPPIYQSMSVLMSEANVMPASVFPMMDPFYYQGPMEYLTNLQRLMSTGEFATSVVKRMSNEWGFDVGVYEVQGGARLHNPMGTRIIEIIALADEPDKVSALANSVAQVLIEQTTNIRSADTDRAIDFLSNQLELVDNNLRDAEVKLNRFKEQEGILTPTFSRLGSTYGGGRAGSGLVGKLSSFQSEVAWIQSEKELTQVQLDSVNDLIAEKKNQLTLSKEVDYLSGSVTPQIKQLQNKISGWQVDLMLLQDTLTDKHYKVVELKRKVENAQEQLQKELDDLIQDKSVSLDPISQWQGLVNQAVQLTVKMNGLDHREKLAAKRLEEFKKENPDFLDKEVQLTRLEREARVREKTYMLLTDRYEEMQLMRQVNSQEFRMVDQAHPPTFPVKPNKVRIITLGVLLGLIMGTGIAWLLEYMDDSIRRVDDVENRVGLPIVGSVPKIQAVSVPAALPAPKDDGENLPDKSPGKSRKLSKEYRKRVEVLQGRLINNISAKSPVAESYRSLWTNIQFADLDKPVKTILVTSPSPKEGKSLTTANLALTMAQADVKVLVIDADLRRPTVHRLFGCEKTPGLSELLTGDPKDIKEYVKNTYTDNLYVLPAGESPPNPVGILGSEKMKQLVEEASNQFDVVLFDSPPVIAMADASILATGLDLTLLVLQAGSTKRHVAMQAKELLQRLRINIFGVVLNGVDYSKRYGYYYYYYHYHNYYNREERGRDEAV